MPDAEVQWPEEITPTRPVRPAAMDAAEEERKPPRNVSLTDPASLWTTAQGGPAFYAYSTNCPVDVDAGIIVDVEASPARRTERSSCWRPQREIYANGAVVDATLRAVILNTFC